jgi:hypothetical protein
MSCQQNLASFNRNAKWILIWALFSYVVSRHFPQILFWSSVSWLVPLAAVILGTAFLFSRKRQQWVLFICELASLTTLCLALFALFNVLFNVGSSEYDDHLRYHYRYNTPCKVKVFLTKGFLLFCLAAVALFASHVFQQAKALRRRCQPRPVSSNVSPCHRAQISSNPSTTERVLLVKRTNEPFYRELDMNKLSSLQSQNLSMFSKIVAVFCGNEKPNGPVRIVKNGEILICCDDDLRRLKHGDKLDITFL